MDTLSVKGRVEVIEWDALTGDELSLYAGPNVVTTVGLDLIAERLRGNTGIGGISVYALGSSNTPPTAGDTQLGNELYRATITQSRVSAGELRITLHLGASQGNGMTFNEGGAFNDQNTLLCHAIFPDKAKTSSKELTIIHTIGIEVA